MAEEEEHRDPEMPGRGRRTEEGDRTAHRGSQGISGMARGTTRGGRASGEGGRETSAIGHESQGAGDINVSDGNMLLIMKDVKEELLERIDSRHADLIRRIDDLVAFMATVKSNAPVRGASSRSRSIEKKKRKEPPTADQLPYFGEVMGMDAAGFVLNWSVLFTLLSIGQTYPSVLDWVPKYAKEYMESFQFEMQGVSALSILFFSVEHNHLYSRYHGRVGKMWSILLRASMTSLVLRARTQIFAKTRPDGEAVAAQPGAVQKPAEPAWLRSFGGKKSSYKAVAEVVECLETTDAMAKEQGDAAYISMRKRIRLDNVPGAGPYELERDWFVRQMRSKVLRDLSYGRSEARSKLIGKIMFVVEKIVGDFDTVEDAKTAGYEVVFHLPTSREEEEVPEEVSTGIWNIPLSATTGGTENQLRALNNDALQQLSMRFPSLQVTLKYKREILSGQSHQQIPSHYHASETVSFHDLALTVLTAATHSASVHVALRTSPQSLRAIHFLAIGLRGHVKSVLKMNLSPLEQLALGNVVHAEVDKRNGDWATTNVYIGTEKRGSGKDKADGTVTVQMLRDAKLTMPVSEYLLLSPAPAENTAEATSRSEVGQNEEEDEDLDLEEDFFISVDTADNE